MLITNLNKIWKNKKLWAPHGRPKCKYKRDAAWYCSYILRNLRRHWLRIGAYDSKIINDNNMADQKCRTKSNLNIHIVTSRDYIFYFSQWYTQRYYKFLLRIFRREGARQGCGAYERDRCNNYFFKIILIYLNNNFYSRI